MVDHSCDLMMMDGLRSFSRRPVTDVRHNALVDRATCEEPLDHCGRSGSATQHQDDVEAGTVTTQRVLDGR